MLMESDGNTDIEVTLQAEPSPEEIENEAALALVVQDFENSSSWLENQQWTERWDEIDILYDSPRIYKAWEQTGVAQPNVQRYIIARHVNSLHPAMVEGLFSDDPPFVTLPRPGTQADTARARGSYIKCQLDEMDFETEVTNGLFQTVLHGTGIYKWGMEWVYQEDTQYIRKAEPIRKTGEMGEEITVHTEESDSFDEKIVKKLVLKPFFENRELRTVLVDSSLRLPDIRKAKFVIDKDYVTLADLLDMKKASDEREEAGEEPLWNLPSIETIRSWFEPPEEQPAVEGNLDSNQQGAPTVAGQGEPPWTKTTEDPSQQGLLRLERTDPYKIITVLNNKVVIQNKPNPYGCINYFSSNWYNRIRAFYGLGVGKIVAQDQRLNQGLTNGGLALLQLIMDPPLVVDDDANTPQQNIRFRKGAILKIKPREGRSARDSMFPLEMPRLPVGEIMTFLGNSENEAEAADGASALTMQGSVPGAGGKSSITRTSGGAQTFANAVNTRLQGPLDRFLQQVFLPWIHKLDELNTKFAPMSQVRDVLGNELGEAFSLDESGFKNSKMRFEALAATRMAAKRVMAQSLPILMQVFLNPEIGNYLKSIGYYVDFKEFTSMWMDATGWPNRFSLIKPLTDEMKGMMQQNDPNLQKIQAQAQAQQASSQEKSQLQTQKTTDGITRDLIKTATDKATESQLVEGIRGVQ